MIFKRLFANNALRKKLKTKIRSFDKSKVDNILLNSLENRKIATLEDWRNIRNEIIENSGPRGLIKSTNIDAIIINACTSMRKYDLAKNYMNFLESEKIQPNLATIGKYFKLLYSRNVNEKITEKDEKEILALYDNVRKMYPMLDSLTLDNIIHAISLTKQWELCLKLLEEIKFTSKPNVLSYSVVIAAAFLNNSDNTAWVLLNEMLESDKIPDEIVYLSYFERKLLDIAAINKLFNFLHNNNLKITKNVANKIIENEEKIGLKSNLTTINHKGFCMNCQQKLNKFELSTEEFANLKNKIVNNIIIGKDVFNKTTQEELEKFKNFIKNMKCFDVVIDGLNVSYSAGVKHSPHVFSSLLSSVVSYFVEKNKTVLVLGRNHMRKWPQKNFNYIKDHATIFLTQDLSQDDPYLLYCALNSGKNTITVTRDLMRGHKFLLKNYKEKCLFAQWLADSQYQLLYVNDKGIPIFKFPFPYSEIAQKNGCYWHLPVEHDEKKNSSTSWLCLKC